MLRELRPDLPFPTPRLFNDLKAEMTKNNIFHIFRSKLIILIILRSFSMQSEDTDLCKLREEKQCYLTEPRD